MAGESENLVIVPDINMLVYAYDSTSRNHARAVEWLETCLSADEEVGLAVPVLFGFVRVVTHPRIFVDPMPSPEATEHVRSWLQVSNVRVLEMSYERVLGGLNLLEKLGTAGNLVTDAQIAGLALSRNAEVHTADADFGRFPSLRWHNPLTGVRVRNPG